MILIATRSWDTKKAPLNGELDKHFMPAPEIPKQKARNEKPRGMTEKELQKLREEVERSEREREAKMAPLKEYIEQNEQLYANVRKFTILFMQTKYPSINIDQRLKDREKQNKQRLPFIEIVGELLKVAASRPKPGDDMYKAIKNALAVLNTFLEKEKAKFSNKEYDEIKKFLRGMQSIVEAQLL